MGVINLGASKRLAYRGVVSVVVGDGAAEFVQRHSSSFKFPLKAASLTQGKGVSIRFNNRTEMEAAIAKFQELGFVGTKAPTVKRYVA